MSTKTQSPADEKHGYVFGCDGVLNINEAVDLLGVCERTVWRYVKENRFRTGKHPGTNRLIICRRSLMSYLSGIES